MWVAGNAFVHNDPGIKCDSVYVFVRSCVYVYVSACLCMCMCGFAILKIDFQFISYVND